MSVTHSRETVLRVRNASNAWLDLSALVSETGLSRDADTPDVTRLTDTAKRYAAGGLLDGSISISGPLDTAGYVALRAILNVEKGFEFYVAGNASGKPVESGSVILKSLEASASAGEVVQITGEFQITGDVTVDVVS